MFKMTLGNEWMQLVKDGVDQWKDYQDFLFSSYVMLHISNILVPLAGLLMSLIHLWLEYFK